MERSKSNRLGENASRMLASPLKKRKCTFVNIRNALDCIATDNIELVNEQSNRTIPLKVIRRLNW